MNTHDALLIRFLDAQILKQKELAERFGSLSEYGRGYADALETVLLAVLSLSDSPLEVNPEKRRKEEA